MEIVVDYEEDVKKVKSDSRGRVTLGKEYSDEEIVIAILERGQEQK